MLANGFGRDARNDPRDAGATTWTSSRLCVLALKSFQQLFRNLHASRVAICQRFHGGPQAIRSSRLDNDFANG